MREVAESAAEVEAERAEVEEEAEKVLCKLDVEGGGTSSSTIKEGDDERAARVVIQ